MDKREKRRWLTRRVAARRRAEHLAKIHDGDVGAVDCVCELADTYFAKRGAVTCGCRKRKRGQPRIGTGVCHGLCEARNQIYRRRAQVRELNRLVVVHSEDPNDDLVAVMEHALT